MEPAFYVLSSADTDVDENSLNTSISGSSHDTSRAKYHIKDIVLFASNLNEAAKASFPNKGRSRYDTVNVSLMRWEQDELNVHPELQRLHTTFQDYGFSTNVWLIPTEDSDRELMSKSIDLLRSADNDRNLFILYYGGHCRLNGARQPEWTCTHDPNYASVNWPAIENLFSKARSDVLILLDTCAAASSTVRSKYGAMEAIVACGFESRAPPPGEYSFTNALIEVLGDWINKRAFSAACLHTEIIEYLRFKERKRGREGIRLEWCTTPIHINYTQNSKLPSIELCRRNVLPAPLEVPPEPERDAFDDAMDIDFDSSNTGLSSLSELTDSGEFRTPHVLIKIGLEQDQAALDMKQWLRWLESAPMLGKWARIEGVYPSLSTLILLSVPISIWDMLPDHPACTFIGYVTAPNLYMRHSLPAEEESEENISSPTLAPGKGLGSETPYTNIYWTANQANLDILRGSHCVLHFTEEGATMYVAQVPPITTEKISEDSSSDEEEQVFKRPGI